VPREWRRRLGGVDSAYAKSGRGKVHWVRVTESSSGTVSPSERALCGVRISSPAVPSLMGGNECKVCYRELWGRD
jgi:hypothetical protein